MIAGIVGLSIVAIFVVLIGTGAGLSRIASAPLWQALTLFPFVGLTVGFLMIITLLVVSARRRSRETQAAPPRSARAAPTTRSTPTTRATRTTRTTRK